MLGLLWYALAFAVVIGLLVTFHEFGHFWTARRVGVKVLRFSVGFGRPLLSRRSPRTGTEYVLAALPLGGYVRMVDEAEGPVGAADLPHAFNRQSLAARSAIVAAGPVANLLLAALLFWAVFMLGVPGLKAVIDTPAAGSIAAEAGFVAGDHLQAVDGKAVATWEEAALALLDGAFAGGRIGVEVRDASGLRRERVLDLAGRPFGRGELDVLEHLGLQVWRPRLDPVLDRVEADSAAHRAGLAAGDRLLAADGEALAQWHDWVRYVQARPEVAIEVQYLRDGAERTTTLVPADAGGAGRAGMVVLADPEAWAGMRTERRAAPPEALLLAGERTLEVSRLVLVVLGKLVIGQAALENISGPLSIAQYAGDSARIGLVPFLLLMAHLSISLAVLNLLPIPMLDGGHLMYYLVEFFKGSPVSERARLIGQQGGLAVLVALMGLAVYNDLARLIH